MVFGGVNGVTIFHPDSIKDNTFIPPVKITQLKVFNESVIPGKKIDGHILLEKSILNTKEITLPHDLNFISFEFVALQFQMSENNQYAYQLKGFDKEWIYCGSRKDVTYTNIDPGKYTFCVKASNNDNYWNSEGTSITIIINPPIWERLWFRLLIAISIFIILYFIVRWRLYAIQKQNDQLEILVTERTKALEDANDTLKIQTDALARSNEELSQFAYAASHDLQEPLRMVHSYLQLLERRNQGNLDKDSLEFMDFAKDGAKRMQSLITDLLELSRVTTQGKPFKEIDCRELMNHVLMNLKIAIEESQTKVTYNCTPNLVGDQGQIERLFQNLISNAVKFCGKRSPVIHVEIKKNENEFQISIQDNGIGIKPKDCDRIFGIFQRLHTREEYAGTGIGLAVCKKIVERHHGTIWVESELNKGTTFHFTLPINSISESIAK